MNYASILDLSNMQPNHEYRELRDQPEPDPESIFPDLFFLTGITLLPILVMFSGIFILNSLS